MDDYKVFKIQVFSKAGVATQYTHLDVFTVGRSKKADIKLKIEGLSRIHFRVERREDEIFVYDDQSANGTRIKNRKIPAGLAINYRPRGEIKVGHSNEVIAIETINGLFDQAYLDSIGMTKMQLQEKLFPKEASSAGPEIEKTKEDERNRKQESLQAEMIAEIENESQEDYIYLVDKSEIKENVPSIPQEKIDSEDNIEVAKKIILEDKEEFKKIEKKERLYRKKLMAESKLKAEEYFNDVKSQADDYLNLARESSEKIKKEALLEENNIIKNAQDKAQEIREKNTQKVEEFIRYKKKEIRKLKENARVEAKAVYADADERNFKSQKELERSIEDKDRVEDEYRKLKDEIKDSQGLFEEIVINIKNIEKEKKVDEEELSELKMSLVEKQAELQRKKDLFELEISRYKSERAQIESESKLKIMRDEMNLEQTQAKKIQIESEIDGHKKKLSECEEIIKNISSLELKENTLKETISSIESEKQDCLKEIERIKNNKNIFQGELDNYEQMVSDNRREISREKERSRIETNDLRLDCDEEIRKAKVQALKEIQEDKKQADEKLDEVKKKYEKEKEKITFLLKSHHEKMRESEKKYEEDFNKIKLSEEKERERLCLAVEKEIKVMKDSAKLEIKVEYEKAEESKDEDTRLHQEKMKVINEKIKERTNYLSNIDLNIKDEIEKRHLLCNKKIEEENNIFQKNKEQERIKMDLEKKKVREAAKLSRENIIALEKKCHEKIKLKIDEAEREIITLKEESKNKIEGEFLDFCKKKERDKLKIEEESKGIISNAREIAELSISKAKKYSDKMIAETESLNEKKSNELKQAISQKEALISDAEKKKEIILNEANEVLQQIKEDYQTAKEDIQFTMKESMSQENERKRVWEKEFLESKKQHEREEATRQLKQLGLEKDKRQEQENKFQLKLKNDGNLIAKNLENVINVKIKNYLGLKNENIDTQSAEMRNTLNALYKDIKVVIGVVIRGESLEGNDALKNLMQFDPNTADKMKKFYRKIGIGVAIPLGLFFISLIFPQLFSGLRLELVKFLSPPESMSDIYVKKIAQERANRPKFNPEQSNEFKKTYTDNILYTRNFIENKLDPAFQDKFTISLNEFILDDLELNEEVVINFISLEIKVIQDLLEAKEMIYFEKKDEGIAELRAIEKNWLPEVIVSLKDQKSYKKLYEFQRVFYNEYVRNHLEKERGPAENKAGLQQGQ